MTTAEGGQASAALERLGGIDILVHVLGGSATPGGQLGLEGIVAKLRDAPYRSGRGETWLKVKCVQSGTFVITGYDPDGRTGVRSLALAEQLGRKLLPAGSVGSGLTAVLSRDLRRRLDAGETVTVEVEYRGRTPSGGLRHPALKGVPEH